MLWGVLETRFQKTPEDPRGGSVPWSVCGRKGADSHVTTIRKLSCDCRTLGVMAKSANREPVPRRPKKRRTQNGGAIIRLSPTVAGAVYDGVSFDDWDDEELMRGRRRNKHGKFTGRPPLVIAASMHQELNRRRFSRAHQIMASSLADAAAMLGSIVRDEQAAPADRIRAAEVLFDRVLGKPRESVSLDIAATSTPKWQLALAQGIVSSLEQVSRVGQHEDVVDGEIVEEQPKPRARQARARRVRRNRAS